MCHPNARNQQLEGVNSALAMVGVRGARLTGVIRAPNPVHYTASSMEEVESAQSSDALRLRGARQTTVQPTEAVQDVAQLTATRQQWAGISIAVHIIPPYMDQNPPQR